MSEYKTRAHAKVGQNFRSSAMFMRWYSTKQQAYEAQQDVDKYLIAKDVNTQGAKCFGWVRSHQHMLQFTHDPSPAHRHFYENTMHDLPCPLFFDIDGTGDMSKLDSILERLVRCVESAFDSLWPGQLHVHPDNVHMSECNRGNILSVHVVIRCYGGINNQEHVFRRPYDMNRFYSVLKAQHGEVSLPDEVDMCVARVGCFRLLGSSKLRERTAVSQPFRPFPKTMTNEEYDATVPTLDDFFKRSVTHVSPNHDYYDMSVENITIKRAVKLRRLVDSTDPGFDPDEEPEWVVPEDSFADARQAIMESFPPDITDAIDDCTNDVIDMVAAFPNSAINKYSQWVKLGLSLTCILQVEYADHPLAPLFKTMYTSIWHSVSQRSIKYDYRTAQSKFDLFRPNVDLSDPVRLLFVFLNQLDRSRAITLPCAYTYTYMSQVDTWRWVHARISHKCVIDPAFGLFTLNTESNLWMLSQNTETAVVHELVNGIVYEELTRRYADVEKRIEDEQSKAIQADPQNMGKAIKDAMAKTTYYKNFAKVVHSDMTLRRMTRLLTCPGFGSTMDTDPYTITFTNCVYHLVSGTLRPIRPEDRVSRTVGYPYMTPTDAEVAEVERVFRDIIWSDSVFEWVMCYMSTCLIGRHHENMVFFTGMPEIPSQNGSNGKSTFMNWIMKALGGYACRLQGTALSTSDFSAPNAHTSHLVPLIGMRAAYVVEIPSDMKLDLDSMIKPVTGGDSIKIRGLGKEEVEAVVPVTLFATCNSLPAVSSRDHATWRRLRAVWFKRWFCDEADRDPNNPLHAPKVDNLHTDDKARTMRMATITLLVRYLTKYINNDMKLPPCAEVDQSTADFRDSTDTLKDFLESNFERGSDEDIHEFRSWVTFKEMKDIAQRKCFNTGRDRDFRNQVKHYYNLEWEDRARVRSRHTNEMEFQRQRKRTVMLGVSPIFNDNTVES